MSQPASYMIHKCAMYRVFVLVAIFVSCSLCLTVYLQVKINMSGVNTKQLPFCYCIAGFRFPSARLGLL
jgi:hypothetical protein